MKLTPLIERFVLHCGEMGSRWGINRTIGQVYALLFLSPTALCAEEICERLGISRSNASVALRELESWRLIRREHRPNDRREFYRAPEDLWLIFRTMIEERHRREVEPTLSMLREALLTEPASAEEFYARERMAAMHELIEQATAWLEQIRLMPPARLRQLLGLGRRLLALLEMAEKAGLLPKSPLEESDHVLA